MLTAFALIAGYAGLSIVISALTHAPMEKLRAEQPGYAKKFGMALIPLSPTHIAFTAYLVLGDYKKNVQSQAIIDGLSRARPFAFLQLATLIVFVIYITSY